MVIHLKLNNNSQQLIINNTFFLGMSKTYQLSNKGPYGTSIKIVPVTTETVTNAIKCLAVNGTNDYHIPPQSSLPDLSNFKVIYLFIFIFLLKLPNDCTIHLLF